MPAIPAWPPRSLPRLFVRHALGERVQVELDPAQAHYLANVMRLGPGSLLKVFNGDSGEWLARVTENTRKRMTIEIERQLREAERIPDVWLAFAPLKRAQTDWLVEKATEIGAARLLPVLTRRTVAERVKRERLEAIAIEAAEQCGRTRLPEIAEPLSLKQALQARDPARRVYFADEAGGGAAVDVFTSGASMILVGPEGGFCDEERALIRAAANVVPVSLGPRILRAETAALAALSAFMALAGDWQTN